ncbi:MAG: flagellar biosynthesis protein FlhA, partial [Gammaproteobacteria bacterium]|nr:flagellar biosynthesis protein FlhA [Gammaproteobacteria bacterium]
TVLLLSTLLRLSLNIASTRVVLLHGHEGTDAAGRVIEAFGEFVIGGDYAVGFVVFAILVIINFVVVTKGAGRVSEVSARFTLDSMPGKQMAIDADLNAGAISQSEAQTRRQEVMQEADFYGSMDGASKFVRGDAIAGILILFINLIGGVAVGTLQHNLSFGDAATIYTLMTIGDGLVAQIPSLILSTATAIIVTRVSSEQDMGGQMATQLVANPRTLVITASIIGGLGLVPGMPNIPFLLLAGVLGFGAWQLFKKRRIAADAAVQPKQELPPPAAQTEPSWEDIGLVDRIGLEVGYRLISLVDRAQGGQLMPRIKGVRKKISQELGFLIPSVHIRDNLELKPNAYRITLHGVPISEAEVYPDRDLAINPGQVYGELEGIRTIDPAFGLAAIWVEGRLRDQAATLGYTVVDCGTVIATHLSQLLQSHAHELLGREEVQQLLESLAKTAPKLVEGLVPDTLPIGTIVRVLQNLLEENVPIRDMRSIVETLAEKSTKNKDAAYLTAAVRVALSRSIIQHFNGLAEQIPVITLEPSLEQILQQSVSVVDEGGISIEPGLADRLHTALIEAVQRVEAAGQVAMLLVSAAIRPMLAHFAKRSVPNLHVIAYNEIPSNKQVKIVTTVGR